jgi:hypothetical protein
MIIIVKRVDEGKEGLHNAEIYVGGWWWRCKGDVFAFSRRPTFGARSSPRKNIVAIAATKLLV